MHIGLNIISYGVYRFNLIYECWGIKIESNYDVYGNDWNGRHNKSIK